MPDLLSELGIEKQNRGRLCRYLQFTRNEEGLLEITSYIFLWFTYVMVCNWCKSKHQPGYSDYQ